MFTFEPLFSTAQVRQIDAEAIRRAGDDGYQLMQKAAGFALRCLREYWPQARRLVVLAGPGNNGGDAFVLARMAAAEGFQLRSYLLGSQAAKLRGAAAKAFADFESSGMQLVSEHPKTCSESPDVIVDGLFGTGLSRAIDGEAQDWLHWIKAQHEDGVGVLALDIPSGLNADSGLAVGDYVHADLTTSFVARKFGHDLGDAIDASSTLRFSDLGVIPSCEMQSQAIAQRLVAVRWPKRQLNAHKGTAGHVGIVGGQPQYAGASVMAAHAALRSGAGKVSLLCDGARMDHAALFPEVMRHSFHDEPEFENLSEAMSSVCVGPGLGREQRQKTILKSLHKLDRPQVWDADALWGLGHWPDFIPRRCVITPHPGEAAQLLGTSTQAIQRDRHAALQKLVVKFGCTVVLKGARTLVGSPGEVPVVVPQGNPAMAVGGMGDVLAGLIAGLCAQGHSEREAAIGGAWLLASTADAVAQEKGQSMLPQDLLARMRVGVA